MVQCSSNLSDKVKILCNNRDIKCMWQITDHCCQGDKLLFPPFLQSASYILCPNRPNLSDVSRRNGTKIRVWLLNNGKVIGGKGAQPARACGIRTYRWSTKLEIVNNPKSTSNVNDWETVEKSYLDALLWVDPSSSCFLLLVFIVVWSG